MEKQKNNSWIILVVISVALVCLIGMTAVSFWVIKKVMEKNYEDTLEDYVNQASGLPPNGTVMSPSEVVMAYMRSTMGTIPGSKYDIGKAKGYTTAAIQNQLDNPVFIPTSYCIQDGPSDVRVDKEEKQGNGAMVLVSANYANSWRPFWEFKLVTAKKEDWKISEIKCLGYSGPTGDPAEIYQDTSQMVKDIPVYIGSTVKSFTDEGSGQSAAYTTPAGVSGSEVLKYYDVNMPAWGWTMISADTDKNRIYRHSDGREAEVWIYYDNAAEGTDYVVESPPFTGHAQ
ncbi:MAG: hypothetical protein ABIC19_01880 [Patescibacteria group bacterium]|nr:hypothetical protein [Patescibacteria group bacterium]